MQRSSLRSKCPRCVGIGARHPSGSLPAIVGMRSRRQAVLEGFVAGVRVLDGLGGHIQCHRPIGISSTEPFEEMLPGHVPVPLEHATDNLKTTAVADDHGALPVTGRDDALVRLVGSMTKSQLLDF